MRETERTRGAPNQHRGAVAPRPVVRKPLFAQQPLPTVSTPSLPGLPCRISRRPLVAMAALTGLRLGELVTLRWSDMRAHKAEEKAQRSKRRQDFSPIFGCRDGSPIYRQNWYRRVFSNA